MSDPYLPFPPEALEAIATRAVETAQAQGAAACMASVSCGGGLNVTLEENGRRAVTRDSSQTISLRVWSEGRTGFASTTLLRLSGLKGLAEEAMGIMRSMEPDEAIAPPDPAWMATDEEHRVSTHEDDVPDLAIIEKSAETLADACRQNAVRSAGVGAACSSHLSALATSSGFLKHQSFSHRSRWCNVITSDGEGMLSGFGSSDGRRWRDLEGETALAFTAARQVLSQRGARSLATCKARVLFDPRVAWHLVEALSVGLFGNAQAYRTGWLAGSLGQSIATPQLVLSENPFEPWGLGSRAFDSEGVAGRARHVVKDGIVQGYFMNTASARRLGMEPTGNADGCANLHLATSMPGETTPRALHQRLDTGLIVTEILGGIADQASGHWRHAIGGFWVSGGEIAFPVRDVTLTGNLRDMLADIETIGADIQRRGIYRTGSILIKEMSIGGGL